MIRLSSFCRSCGEVVLWPKREDGKISRPVVYKSNGFTITDNVINYTTTDIYEYHVCDPAKIEAFSDERTQQNALRAEYEENLRLAQIEGLKHICPKCEAKINEACINLTEKKKGNVVKVRWPHPERLSNATSSTKNKS